MYAGAVIAFAAVVLKNLPVAGHLEGHFPVEGEIIESVSTESLRRASKCLRKRHSLEIEVHEYKRTPRLDLKLRQTLLFAAERFCPLEVRGAEKRTIQLVGPAVVYALKTRHNSTALSNRSSSMPTNIRECPQDTVHCPNYNNGFTSNLSREISAGTGHLVQTTDP